MKQFLIIPLLLLILSPFAYAGGGSNYTIFGLGDLRLSGSVRNNGLGYSGLALSDGNGTNINSPASWSGIKDTRLEAGLLYEAFDATDGQKSLFLSITNFNGASLAIPISTLYGIVFVGSLSPYSNKDYSVFTSGSQQGMDYVIRHTGKGGLGKGQVGVSFAPLDFFSVGASMNYLFGSLEDSRTLLPTTINHAGGETTGRVTANGITGTFGAIVRGIWLLDKLSAGITVTTRGYLGAEGDFLFESEEEEDTLTVNVSDLLIPPSVGIGMSWQPGRLAIAADFSQMFWSEANFPTTTRNARLLSVGIEHRPSQEPGASVWNRMALRLGGYLHETYYVVNGQPIDEWGVTAGFGVPFSGESRLNFAFEYGERGSTSYNLIKESIYRISVGLTISETWFQTFDDE